MTMPTDDATRLPTSLSDNANNDSENSEPVVRWRRRRRRPAPHTAISDAYDDVAPLNMTNTQVHAQCKVKTSKTFSPAFSDKDDENDENTVCFNGHQGACLCAEEYRNDRLIQRYYQEPELQKALSMHPYPLYNPWGKPKTTITLTPPNPESKLPQLEPNVLAVRKVPKAGTAKKPLGTSTTSKPAKKPQLRTQGKAPEDDKPKRHPTKKVTVAAIQNNQSSMPVTVMRKFTPRQSQGTQVPSKPSRLAKLKATATIDAYSWGLRS